MYTAGSADKLYININVAGADRRDSATSGFVQPGLRGDDVLQGAAIAELIPNISIACRRDDDRTADASFSDGYRAGSINRATENADWS